MTLPQPGQWVRVNHACPGVEDKHREPVEVTDVLPRFGWLTGDAKGSRIYTRRCDGGVLTIWAKPDGTPVFGDEWEVME